MSDFVHIADFGADPSLPDNHAFIQAAIFHAIANNIPEVRWGHGRYKGSKGLVAANFDGTKFSFFGLKITAPKMSYGNFSSTSYEVTSPNQFGIAIQWAKGFELENIAFYGKNQTSTKMDEIYTGKREYFVSGEFTQGIIADEFHINAPFKYPGWENYYVNTGTTGSTYIKISGCSSYNFVESISLSPSGTQNGDCIIIENCWTGYNYNAVVINQSQNKSVTIRNLNQWTPSHTIFDIRAAGFPPSIKDCQFAGGQYQFINGSTNWGVLKVENVVCEKLYRLGNIGTGWTPVKFEHCQFNFQNDFPKSNCLWQGSAHFDTCVIRYYDGKKNILPTWISNNLRFRNTMLSSPVHPHNYGANYNQFQIDNIQYEKETPLYLWGPTYFTSYLNWTPSEPVTLTRVNNTYQFVGNKVYAEGDVLIAVFPAPIPLDNGKTSWSCPIGVVTGQTHDIIHVGRIINIGNFETLNVQIGKLQ